MGGVNVLVKFIEKCLEMETNNIIELQNIIKQNEINREKNKSTPMFCQGEPVQSSAVQEMTGSEEEKDPTEGRVVPGPTRGYEDEVTEPLTKSRDLFRNQELKSHK